MSCFPIKDDIPYPSKPLDTSLQIIQPTQYLPWQLQLIRDVGCSSMNVDNYRKNIDQHCEWNLNYRISTIWIELKSYGSKSLKYSYLTGFAHFLVSAGWFCFEKPILRSISACGYLPYHYYRMRNISYCRIAFHIFAPFISSIHAALAA